MNIVSQKANFRQSVVLYSFRNSIFATIRRFGVSRATIYRWRKRYNGTTQSLVEYSRRPHSHPNQHTPEELKLISDMRRRNPNDGLVFFWTKLVFHEGFLIPQPRAGTSCHHLLRPVLECVEAPAQEGAPVEMGKGGTDRGEGLLGKWGPEWV